MSTFILTIDANSVYVTDAPVLEILVGGVVVSSLTIGASYTTSSYSFEFSGTYPSSLSFRFNDGSVEAGRSINLNNISLNGQNINAHVSQTSLNQNDVSAVDTIATSAQFGETELELSDLNPVTILGDAGKNKLIGTTGIDVIDGGDDNDNIKGLDGNDQLHGGGGNDIIRGGNGDDIILGGDDNDLLMGEAGNDSIYGGNGRDNIRGGTGNDFLHAGEGDDIVRGEDGDDTIFGNAGNDILKGENGNDTLIGGAGLDLLEGGAGDDLLSGGDDNDTLRGGAGVDTLSGDSGNDRLFGDDGDDILNGGAGNDLIKGGTGNDTANGGDGNDIIKTEDGDDILNGGAGNDGLYGGAGVDTINGGTGRDRIEGGDDNDTLHGNEENDTVLGDGGVDYVYGDDGNDRVRGGDDNDFVYGGEGNDQVFGDAGDDQVWGGNGNDLVNGNEGDDILYGEAGLDKIFGHEGNDTIYGGDDNDRIYGNEGDDVINGDDGNDTLYASSVHEIITVTETVAEVGARIAALNTGVVYNEATNSFYQFVSGSFNWNTANSNANAATLTGLTGVNGHLANITSAAENSFVQSLTGTNYSWVGGTDSGTEGEWVYTTGAEAGTTYWSGGTGGGPVGGAYTNFYNGSPGSGNASYDYSLFLGSNFNGQIFAYTSTYNADYVIEWDAGDLSLLALDNDIFKVMDEGATNIVNGGAGADTIYGSAGNDTLNGGTGNDAIHSGTATTEQGAIDAVLAANNGLAYNAATNSFYLYVSGTITHTAAETAANAATLTGLDGVTGHLATLTSAAEQTFVGTLVNNGDWAWVDGSDTASEGTFVYESGAEAGTGFDTNLTWYNGSPASTNQASRDNVLIWDGGGDVLYAWADTSNARGYVIEWDASTLINSVGVNTLNGGEGADDLYGGAGKDIFVFDNTNDIDEIFDFSTAQGDAIDINDVLSYNSATDTLSDFVQLSESGGNTIISVDTDGTAGGSNFVNIASIDGVTGLDLATLVAGNNLIVE